MYIRIEKTLLKGPVGLDVDQHINMLQTIYEDEFDYIQLKSQQLTLSSSIKLKLKSNMPLKLKGLISTFKSGVSTSTVLLSHACLKRSESTKL